MKFLNARTLELDEPEIAVAEILEQLDLENNALKHSVGILTCSYDYIETGMAASVCEALPFDVIVCTTLTNANNDESGTMLLCLTVLTADDCLFVTSMTPSLKENADMDCIYASVEQAASELGQPVKLAIAFFPLLSTGSLGILDKLDDALKGVPIFGTIACDHDTANYSNTHVIRNGGHHRECLSFLLIAGNVNPKYVLASTSEQRLRKQLAVITSSEGCLLKEANNMSAKDYLTSIGITTDVGVEALSSVPFVVDYGDGTQPAARAIYGFDENGYATFGGVIPEGGKLSIGTMDVEDILYTAEKSSEKLIDKDDLNGIILFPCLGRNMILTLDPMQEIDVVRKVIGDRVPWHLAYSAGECCPVYDKDGKTVNRFHNFTFIGCAL